MFLYVYWRTTSANDDDDDDDDEDDDDNLIVRIGKTEAEVINNKRLRLRYCTADRHAVCLRQNEFLVRSTGRLCLRRVRVCQLTV